MNQHMIEMPRRKLCYIDETKRYDEKNGIISFILTKQVVDRDSEVLMSQGGDFSNFRKNPRLLWHHRRDIPSLGRIIPDSIKILPEMVTADAQFDIVGDPFAEMIFFKLANGFLDAGSIGFRGKQIGDPIFPEQRGVTFLVWEALEYSVVNIPANAEALSDKSLEDHLRDLAKFDPLFYDFEKQGADVWLREKQEILNQQYSTNEDSMKDGGNGGDNFHTTNYYIVNGGDSTLAMLPGFVSKDNGQDAGAAAAGSEDEKPGSDTAGADSAAQSAADGTDNGAGDEQQTVEVEDTTGEFTEDELAAIQEEVLLAFLPLLNEEQYQLVTVSDETMTAFADEMINQIGESN